MSTWSLGQRQAVVELELVSEVHATTTIFGKFWRRLTSFPDETTYFGMSIRPSIKLIPFVDRIIAVEKPVTIYTMPSMAFFGEPG